MADTALSNEKTDTKQVEKFSQIEGEDIVVHRANDG